MRETFFLVRRRIHCCFEIEEVHLCLLERFSYGSFSFVAAVLNRPSGSNANAVQRFKRNVLHFMASTFVLMLIINNFCLKISEILKNKDKKKVY